MSSSTLGPPSTSSAQTAPPVSAPTRPPASARGRVARRIVAAMLLVTGLLTLSYAGLSTYIATQIVYTAPEPILITPADYALAYRDVTFTSRDDALVLRGWFIPGILPDGTLTAERTIIVVPGGQQNRTDIYGGALSVSADLARNGFAVLAYDPRGTGDSQAAPFSMGYFEQRDVLGAVDFLRTGKLPYPELGHPRIIGAWGVSTGATSALLAAAQEPAIHAVVSDTASAQAVPLLEQQIIERSGLPAFVVPGSLVAARVLYGIDYYAVRPVDEVARLAPRPVFFIHGDHDPWLPISNMTELVRAAETGRGAQVQSWVVPGVPDHAQAFHTAPVEYMQRVLAFFTASLGPSSGK